MSHAQDVANAPDDTLRYKASNSHAFYIGLGKKITVSWMPKYGRFWCATCNLNECEHVERVASWMVDNDPPDYLKAD